MMMMSRMMIKYNEVNAELKVTQKSIVFLKIVQADMREIFSLVNSISRTEGVNSL
jgi:hypothetical protein